MAAREAAPTHRQRRGRGIARRLLQLSADSCNRPSTLPRCQLKRPRCGAGCDVYVCLTYFRAHTRPGCRLRSSSPHARAAAPQAPTTWTWSTCHGLAHDTRRRCTRPYHAYAYARVWVRAALHRPHGDYPRTACTHTVRQLKTRLKSEISALSVRCALYYIRALEPDERLVPASCFHGAASGRRVPPPCACRVSSKK
jgi:hypothetical protein